MLGKVFLGDLGAVTRIFLIADGVVSGHSRRTSDGGRGVMRIGSYMYALLGELLNTLSVFSINPIGRWSESK